MAVLSTPRVAPYPVSSPPADELTRLARTFDDATHAVWIHDSSGRCVYRNQVARHAVPCIAKDTIHAIVDHQDRRIGHFRFRIE